MIALLALAAAAAFRPVPPENLLVVDTSVGRMLVELRPDLAPRAVERIRTLARRGVYDGLLFHRVIDGFVDQTGNPNNRDGGGTELPDLAAEFDARMPDAALAVVGRRDGAPEGFLGALPVEAAPRLGPDGRRRAWARYCAGVVGMGRQAGVDTANSEIFFMRAAAPELDHLYTAVGRVVVGAEAVRRVAVGEPPPAPDRLVRVRVAADLGPEARPTVLVEDPASPAFRRRVSAARARLGADFSACAVEPAARLQGETSR